MPDVPDSYLLAYYLDLRPGRVWQFRDQVSGNVFRGQCRHPAPGRIEVSVDGKFAATHFFTTDMAGQRLTWTGSSMSGLGTVQWKDGLQFPHSFRPGDTCSATSVDPVQGNDHVVARARFKRFVQLKVPPGSPLPHEPDGLFLGCTVSDTAVLEMGVSLSLSKLGFTLLSGSLFLAYGEGGGLVQAKLNSAGVWSILELTGREP